MNIWLHKLKHVQLLSADMRLFLVVEFQFCLKLSLLAALPPSYGIYIDVESKFSSRRAFNYTMLLVVYSLYLCNGRMTFLVFQLRLSRQDD